MLVIVLFCAAIPFLADAQTLETARLTFAPEVPASIVREKAAVVRVDLKTQEVPGVLMGGLDESSSTQYPFWTFNGKVPGPFIRVRQGDTIELHISSAKNNTMPHNIDMHAVMGPGGGADVTLVQPGETKIVRFSMLKSGLYLYHCAAPPMTDHIANGMYGLLLVEPPEGLPPVDREFYVMQSEFYTKEEFGASGPVTYDRDRAIKEDPTYVVFNGRQDSLTEDGALKAKTGEKIRIFFGNAGPNLTASFHIVGVIFDKVYREGSTVSEPGKDIQTTLVPAGGAAIVELSPRVAGSYTLVDHAIFRAEKGAMGGLRIR